MPQAGHQRVESARGRRARRGAGPCLALLALALAPGAPARAEDGALLAEDQAWLAARPVIRVGLEPAYAPFSFLGPDGRPAGISVDYLRLLEGHLGVRFEVVEIAPLPALLEAVRAGRLDALTSLADTPERRAFLAFTAPYVQSPAVLVERQGRAPLLLPDLAGRRVAVGRGYAVAEHLRSRHPGLLLDERTDDTACLERVLTGEADAAVVDLASFSWIVTRHGIQGLAAVGDAGYTYALALATPRDQPRLGRVLSEGLRRITPAEARRVQETWVRLDVDRGLGGRFWRWLGAGLLAALALLLATRGVNWALRRTIARRTRDLRDSEEMLSALFEQAGDAIVVFDPETAAFTRFNAAAHEQLGYGREEFARMGVAGIATDSPETIRANVARMLEPGGAVIETRNRRRDGRSE